MQRIRIYAKNVYGRDLVYMEDPEIERNIQALTGKKTLGEPEIEALKNLGVEFEQVVERKVL